MTEKRYYYKLEDGSAWWSLKSPEQPAGSVEITQEEWETHMSELENGQEN